MPQWPLPSEKLKAAKELVQEQLDLGHVEPTQSPWNTPIFVVKKKSGKWRLLHDLRAINAQMKVMGPVQKGLPLLSALPKDWRIIVVDIKDCFFSIPLNKKDKPRFAFTLPSINHMEPDKRYQWRVLPQGMANSPTICQLYVGKALQPVRDGSPSLKICHYMDDIVICGPEEESIQQAYGLLNETLKNNGLIIAPEKVQQSNVSHFLGATITLRCVTPQKISIRKDHLKTLNDFQKLLGDINWIRPYLRIPTSELKPLFQILEGDSHITSLRQLTPEASDVLRKVERAIQKAQLNRINEQEPLYLCILRTINLPTAVLWQDGPLVWIHPHISPNKTIEHYPTMVANMAHKGIKTSITHFGKMPDSIIVPYTVAQMQILCATIDEWAILRCSFSGLIDNHYPKHPLLHFMLLHPVIFPKVTANTPIKGAIDIYTDGSKTGIGSYVINEKAVRLQFTPGAPQLVECLVVLEVFKRFPMPINIISDSVYVVNAVLALETAGNFKQSSPVSEILMKIQNCILMREHPFYIQHIRAHTSLPGPMVKGNAIADSATRDMVFLSQSSIESAKNFHQLYHVPASTLRQKFKLTRTEARNIVLQCGKCVEFINAPSVGVNPRGLRPLDVWQMDVTHIPSFGKLQYVHVSIDTSSGVLHASPLTGEKAVHVISHCLEAWAAWGKPLVLKTDNGPAYTSSKFSQFCKQMQVKHITGLPYNPQGQGIIERAHRTLKQYLQKQKGGIEAMTPKMALSLTIFTLNFLKLDDAGRSPAERHGQWPQSPNEMVKWKNVLDNKWYGPDPILIRSRGAICVFPQGEENPLWVLTRLTRTVKDQDESQDDPVILTPDD